MSGIPVRPAFPSERSAEGVAASHLPPAERSPGHAASAHDHHWLPIGRAAALLGVSPATLRLWTAAGKVPAKVTPGGHRRYAAADLQRLLAQREGAAWQEAAAQLVEVLRARYAELARDRLQRQAWFQRFDAQARARAHALGELLLAQVAQLITARGAPGESQRRAHLLRSGRRIGTAYGREIARRGLTAAEAVEAFLFFRTPILESVNATARAHPDLALPAGEALAAVTQFLDTVLLALTRSYERCAAAQRRPHGTPARKDAL
ncbi:MAG TPA: MerR family DNA-binding transcriptional regulator [Chloroflexota bacterium]|nr:MerR family DNA-binding transcriptional regulator [Chloroflexota bacterium]